MARQGKAVGDTEPVELPAVASQAWHNVETYDADLLYDGDENGAATVDADAGRLCELFENLFRNAIEHGGGDVTIRFEHFEGGFAITDDGPGIPTEKREQVFDHGFSTGESGTGFGLSIVRTIAEAHGWAVTVTGGESGGARFEICV